jgi:hypothetical protein
VRKSSSFSSSGSLGGSATSSTTGDQYEVYVRPDGKKVRRIRRSAIDAQDGQSTNSGQPSLASMLSNDKAIAAK